MTVHLELIIAKLVVLVLGLAISTLTFLAYRRTGSRLLLYVGIGVGLIAFGSFIEGILFEVIQWPLLEVHIVESVFVVSGLGLIAVLLRPRPTPREA